ncbi:MAG TPA: helix-turn-helix transcriptional regulator [Dongiaceae bacterium]|nr:helix-turn-helix transcriptional regulator [Dongiaceae bacterium]
MQPQAILPPFFHDLLQGCRDHVYRNQPPVLAGMGLFHCHQPQALRAVPLHQPSLVLVLNGTKRIYWRGERTDCHVGDLLLFPAMSEVQLENIPDPAQSEYLALCVSFAPDTVSRFTTAFGGNSQPRNELLRAPAPDAVLQSLLQRLQWTDTGGNAEWWLELRQQELLAHCAQQGWLGYLVREQGPSAAQRIASLLATDCARNWRITDACTALAMSESTLRRELQRENTGFREILEQVRLTHALGLLQGSRRNIAEIAGMVGYDSPSRFAARFRQRFGMSPGEVKQSRERATERLTDGLTDSGANLTESGATNLVAQH